MRLKSIELSGFKSFAKKTELEFASAITSIVGPNGSGKSNIAESFRFVLGEQSMKSMRGKRSEDLIWNGSAASPRAGRASVKLFFDNSDRALNLDFDEVSIERVVNRDGSNDYLLNNSLVRLRDINELLSQANIGASGHHIISQGEADRILSSSSRERREMIEDALGLTAYLYKREEAKKKLEKTAENMREVEGLRKELAPHLRFLQSQVKKVEESQKLRDELGERYVEYLKRESIYLTHEEARLKRDKKEPEHEQQSLEERIARLREQLERKHDNGSDALVHLEEEGRQLLRERDSLGRKLGRIEGELAATKRVVAVEIEQVAVKEVEMFAAEVGERIQSALQVSGDTIIERLSSLVGYVNDFVARIKKTGAATDAASEKELLKEKESLERELSAVEKKEEKIVQELSQLRAHLESQKDASRDAERELFSALARRSELESILAKLRSELQQVERAKESFKHELGEAAAFIGRAVLEYETHVVHDAHGTPQTEALVLEEPRHAQEDRRKKIERIKIRLEEAGLGSTSEILKEFEETSSRDAFLARELEDLDASRTSLLTLIEELAQTLQAKFASGIEKINTEFNTFFITMFGGGSAALSLISSQSRSGEDLEDEEEQEEGIEIAISLPHKRIKGLHMLSGGERALTSIALIFAMSQVHPPPFLILDETDAALDEANSRRYGDMIATLAKKSQLILVTHNRETMSRAGVLYGVTMGSDGVSKLLSVRFEDALAVAK